LIVQFSGLPGLYGVMTNRFVRLPTELLEALLRARLSGTQWRIVLWIIRQTYGWNRESAPFTWYRMARELAISRPAVYRAGLKLVASGVLVTQGKRLAVARAQRPELPLSNATDAARQRNSCLEATLFRPAKDSSKDKLKTYKDKRWNHSGGERKMAGAASPRPGKYERLSEN
jgi:phage replication O-like protein O